MGWRGAVVLSVVITSGLLCTEDCARAQARPAPHAEEIIQKVIERARQAKNQDLDAKYTYTQRGTLDELDSNERVKRHEERLSQMVLIEGEPYMRLVEKDGKPLAERDAKLELERERKFRQRLADRKRRKEEGKKDDADLDLNEDLMSKYRFELIGSEMVNGRPAFVVSFEPKRNDLAVHGRLDRLLNKLAGRLWVDRQDYVIARADMHLAENITAWGGMLASVRKFVARIEQVKVDDAVWLPTYGDVYVDGRILIRSLHVKFIARNSDFRQMDTVAVQPQAGKQ